MSSKLPKVPEPSMTNLKNRVDMSGFEERYGITNSDEYIAKKGVPSYIYEKWKNHPSIEWNRIQKVDASYLIESWVKGEADWEEVVDLYRDRLE